MPYRFEEHTADARFVAWGSSWEEVAESAAKAFYEVCLEGKIEPKKEKRITVESETIEGLIHDFLESLLFELDVDGFVGGEFKIKITRNGTWKLEALVKGEKFDPKKHTPVSEVKAVTYHGLKAWEENGKKFIRVVLDL